MFANICILFAIIAAAQAQVNFDPIQLGECAKFAIHGGAKVAFNGEITTIHQGNVGMSPGTSITGNYIVENGGSTEVTSTSANKCADDRTTAYNQIKLAPCGTIRNDYGGQTLTAGVYCDAGAPMLVSSDLVLSGPGQFLFQASSSLQTSLNTKITYVAGALPENVFWAVSSSTTIGTGSEFVGTLITYASISFETNAVMKGRALAGAAVTFQTLNQVTRPNISPI
jgi:hypothetical protein